MAEQSYNPADYTVDDVNAYLADASQEERARVLEAEQDGEGRKGILGGPYGTGQADPSDPEEGESQPTGSGTVHQDGAPEDLVAVVEEAEEKGYLGQSADKEDHSQRNPDVMNGGE